MSVIDLAKARADFIHKRRGEPRGAFLADPALTGDHVLVRWDNGQKGLSVILTIEEAEEFRKDLALAVFKAHHLHRKVHGFIMLGWCRPSGETIGDHRAQARIVERLESSVRIQIIGEVNLYSRHGKPADGLYQLDGWHEDYVPNRPGWRVLSNLTQKK
jgi:hypothetical protein